MKRVVKVMKKMLEMLKKMLESFTTRNATKKRKGVNISVKFDTLEEMVKTVVSTMCRDPRLLYRAEGYSRLLSELGRSYTELRSLDEFNELILDTAATEIGCGRIRGFETYLGSQHLIQDVVDERELSTQERKERFMYLADMTIRKVYFTETRYSLSEIVEGFIGKEVTE